MFTNFSGWCRRKNSVIRGASSPCPDLRALILINRGNSPPVSPLSRQIVSRRRRETLLAHIFIYNLYYMVQILPRRCLMPSFRPKRKRSGEISLSIAFGSEISRQARNDKERNLLPQFSSHDDPWRCEQFKAPAECCEGVY